MQEFGKNRNKLLEMRLHFGFDGSDFTDAFAQLAHSHTVILILTTVLINGPAVSGPKRILSIFVMLPDLETFRPDLDTLGIPRDRQDAIIHSLWDFAGCVADQAFGIDATQLAMPVSDKADCEHEDRGLESEDTFLKDVFIGCAAAQIEEGTND